MPAAALARSTPDAATRPANDSAPTRFAANVARIVPRALWEHHHGGGHEIGAREDDERQCDAEDEAAHEFGESVPGGREWTGGGHHEDDADPDVRTREHAGDDESPGGA